MIASVRQPSNRLRRTAAAERAAVERDRERLLLKRERLAAQAREQRGHTPELTNQRATGARDHAPGNSNFGAAGQEPVMGTGRAAALAGSADPEMGAGTSAPRLSVESRLLVGAASRSAPSRWKVYDMEGRVYGYYPHEEMARDAAASCSRGYPWRVIRYRKDRP